MSTTGSTDVAIEPMFRLKLEELGMTLKEVDAFGKLGMTDVGQFALLDDDEIEDLLDNTESLKGLNVLRKYKIRALHSWINIKKRDKNRQRYNDDDEDNRMLLSHFDTKECNKEMKKVLEADSEKKKGRGGRNGRKKKNKTKDEEKEPLKGSSNGGSKVAPVNEEMDRESTTYKFINGEENKKKKDAKYKEPTCLDQMINCCLYCECCKK